jgi:lysophospholipase L1-like esterase
MNIIPISALADSVPLVLEGSLYMGSPFARAIFTTTSRKIVVHASETGIFTRFPTYCACGLVINGVYTATFVFRAAGANNFIYPLPDGTNTVEVVTGVQSSLDEVLPASGISLVSVRLDDTPAQTFPAPTRRGVIYGDSIAVGGNATTPTSQSWAMLVRAGYTGGAVALEAWGFRSLYQDYSTIGISELVAKLLTSNPTWVWLAIGTNDFGLGHWSAASFGTQYAALLDALHAASPTLSIFAQTPLIRSPDSTTGDFRIQIATAQSTRSTFVTLVDGTVILSSGDLADGVHPTTAGHAMIATYVSAILP